MRKIVALLAAVPLVAVAQGSAPPQPPAQAPTAQPAPPQDAPPAPSQPAAAPAAPQPAQYAPPPPQYAPPPPQYAPPPPQYAPPPPQYAPPPPAPPAPAQYYRPPEKQRGSWYIGFGLGGGDGRVLFTDETVDFKDMVYPGGDVFAFNFRVGATVSPRLLAGLDLGFVGASSEQNGDNSSIDLSYFDAGLMFFPTGRGFYLRGGLGASTIDWKVEPFIDASARGFNVLGGIGYAFWLGRAFNLTLNLDAQRHFFDEDDLEGGTSWSAWVGFDWY